MAPERQRSLFGAAQCVQRRVKRTEPSLGRQPPLETLWKEAAVRAGLSFEALRHGGRSVRGGEVRAGFIRQAVLAVGYRAATVASFAGCPASSISRTLQKKGMAR